MTQGPEERRRTERITTRTLVEIRIPDWQVLHLVYTVNISQGGIRVSMPQSLPMGAAVDVILTLPNGHRLHLPGRVAHLGAGETGDVGIRFDELSPKTHQEINGYLSMLRAGATPGPTGIPSGVLIKKSS
jgi:Tfp pilus assembly protein PilZ